MDTPADQPLELPELRLLGHGGLVDALNQTLATLGAHASIIRSIAARGDIESLPDAAARLQRNLERLDAISGVLRHAAHGGALAEIEQAETFLASERVIENRRHWDQRVAEGSFTDAERALFAWIRDVTPR